MAKFRAETVEDPATGLIYLEVFYPDTATEPYVRSAPQYKSHEEAAKAAVDTLKTAFPGKPVKIV